MHDPALSVRPLAAEELRLVERSLRQGMPEKHRKRLERQQRGRAVYLIAWHAMLPVGHLLLKWTTDESITTIPVLRRWPELEDFFVVPAYRAQGLGAGLLEEAEGLARQMGYARLGLAVGLTADYDPARRLYQRRGYVDAGLGTYYDHWCYLDSYGRLQWREELCAYLIKDL